MTTSTSLTDPRNPAPIDEAIIELVFDAAGSLTFVSPHAEPLIGLSPDEAIGFGYLASVHTDDLSSMQHQVDVAIELRHSVGVRFRVINQRTRAVRLLVGHATPLYDDPTTKEGFRGALVRVLECADASVLAYDDWFASSTSLFCVVDFEGVITSASPRTVEFLTTGGPVIGTSVFDWVHESDRDRALATFAFVADNPVVERPIAVELRLVTEHGERVVEIFGRNMGHVPAARGIVLDGRDVTYRARIEEALETSEKRHRTLVESMPLALVATGKDRVIRFANPAMGRLVGYDPTELVGRSILDLYTQSTREVATAAIEAGRIRTGFTVERTMVHANGQLIETVQTFTVQNDDLIVAGVLDVTAERAALVAAAAAQRELTIATTTKNELVSRVSHELRTPLHAIAGYADLLSAELSPRGLEYRTRLLTAIEHLRILIDDALTVTSLDQHDAPMLFGDTTLEALSTQAINMVTPSATARQIALETSFSPSLGPITTDVTRLTQVVVNLLSNAVKFAPAASTVTLTTHEECDTVTLSVHDEGPGITPGEVDRLFQPFTRGPNSAGVTGSGLGLRIVASTLDALGGSIAVDHATFTVTLPRHPHQQIVHPSVQPKVTSVLHVDDDPSSEILRHQFEAAGHFNYRHAATLSSARAMVDDAMPDVIVLDINLPDGSGSELIADLEHRRAGSSADVIVTTADASSETKRHLLSYGVGEYLVKPFSFDELLTATRRQLSRHLR